MEVSRRKLWLPMMGMARQALAGNKDAEYLASKIESIVDAYRKQKNDSLQSYEEEYEEIFEEAIEGYHPIDDDDQSAAMEGNDEDQIKGPI